MVVTTKARIRERICLINMEFKCFKVSKRKGTTKFADVQILSEKSFRSFKSFKGKSCLENGARRLLFRV